MTTKEKPVFGYGATLAQVALLGAATPPGEVKTRPGKGGSGDLSYVDARFVQDRFDDAVGPINWQRRHFVDANGNVGCEVGVLVDFGEGHVEWVWKSDIGTESTIESIKGQYSDSFKRASVNWGVARDLYDEESEARQAAAARRTAGTFVPQPSVALQRAQHMEEDPNPNWLCPIHGTRKVVPAGVSKAGRAYPAFAACTERECDQKPSRSQRGVRTPSPAFVGMNE